MNTAWFGLACLGLAVIVFAVLVYIGRIQSKATEVKFPEWMQEPEDMEVEDDELDVEQDLGDNTVWVRPKRK